VPAMVKRESLELGAQRNWLLTRTSPTSTAEMYTQSQWQNAPRATRAFAARAYAGCKTTGTRLDDLSCSGGEKRAAPLQRSTKHPGPYYYHDLQHEEVCAPQRSSEARSSLGDTEEEKQWAISPLTLCGVSV
jgi:hypothetical protein